MSDPTTPESGQGADASYKAGGALVVHSLPDEIGVPVRRYQFDILCEGGIGEAKASRDVYIGVCAAAFAGLVGVLVAIDWEAVFNPEHRYKLILCAGATLLLLVMGSVSGAGICIHEKRRKRTLADSPFAREKQRLLELYEARSQTKSD